jgi:hypothetical protein
LERRIDRASDQYYEHIEDEETGEVVGHVEEPLREHLGRGSARHRSIPVQTSEEDELR